MSLLMDALKKAEQAKSKSDDGMLPAPTEPEKPSSHEELEAQVQDVVDVANEPEDGLANANSEVVDESVDLPADGKLTLSLDEVVMIEPVNLEMQEPEVKESVTSAEARGIDDSASLADATMEPQPEIEPTVEPQQQAIPSEQSVIRTSAEPRGIDNSASLVEAPMEPRPEPEPTVEPQQQVISPEPPVTSTSPVQPESPVPVSAEKVKAEVPVAKKVLTPPRTSPMSIGKHKFNRTYLWAGLVIVLALLGFGYYLMAMLESTQSQSTLALSANDWQSEEISEEVVAEVETVAPVLAAPTEQLAPVADKEVIRSVQAPMAKEIVSTPDVAVAEKATPAAKTQALPQRPTQTPARTFSIQRTEIEDPLFSVLQQAYAKYQSGELASAEQLYLQVLQRDSRNRDALMGQAAIARKQGRQADARTLYGRLLTLNPKDSMAAAGLMALSGQGLSTGNATQLKLMLNEEPSAAHLHFALGNEYASHSHWSEAQQAYFEAYRFSPNNGDYAYNLAVSLERIGQPKAALDYYRRALELASGSAEGFDPVTVMQRIDIINQAGDR